MYLVRHLLDLILEVSSIVIRFLNPTNGENGLSEAVLTSVFFGLPYLIIIVLCLFDAII